MTTYRFSRPAFLEPHTIRLHPRQDGGVERIGQDLLVQPAPAGRTMYLDALGNLVTQVWFDRLSEHLRIESRLTAETTRSNPFDYVLSPEAQRLPVRYQEEALLLAPYLTRIEDSAAVADLACRGALSCRAVTRLDS